MGHLSLICTGLSSITIHCYEYPEDSLS